MYLVFKAKSFRDLEDEFIWLIDFPTSINLILKSFLPMYLVFALDMLVLSVCVTFNFWKH